MNNFRRVSACVLAGMVLLLASGPSYSLGFGEPDSQAILGDTLRLTVPVRLEPGEEIADECVGADVYFGDEKLRAGAVSTEVLPGSAFLRTVKVRTTALINEPIVTIYVAAGCHARITRKFVVLADPPPMPPTTRAGVTSGTSKATASASGAPIAVPVPAPGVTSTRLPAEPSGSAAPPALATKAGTNAVVVPRPAPKPAARAQNAAASGHPRRHPRNGGIGNTGGMKSPATKTSKPAAPRQEVPRLELDPVESDAMVSPSLRLSPSLGQMPKEGEALDATQQAQRDAAAAVWRALNATPEQMAKDQARLKDLTQRLEQLQAEGEAQHRADATLRAQMAASGQSTGSKWWLALLVITALALGLAYYFYRELRRQQREGQAWWQGSAQSEPVPMSTLDEEEERADPEHTTTEFVHVPSQATEAPAPLSAAPVPPPSTLMAQAQQVPEQPAARPVATQPLHGLVPDRMPALAVPPAPARPLPPIKPQPESLREVSVEELIDLEQQAEFFIVLGQDDAAIDLLESHVQGTTAASPLPFLKLMEIYRRLGRRDDYERVQSAFNERFNAHAPAWDADMQQGHDLVDYPGIVERLQALWSRPDMAMEVLERSLTRPESGDDTFELPAYRELLLLYAVARDLSERETADRSKVDLLLPLTELDEPGLAVGDDSRVIQPLMATRPVKAQPNLSPSIKVDVSLDDLDDSHKP